MNYSKYMELLRRHLTDVEGFEKLLQEAKQNHRVQKLLVAYIMKDTETYQEMTELVLSDDFAAKILSHAQYTLWIIKSGPFYKRIKMKGLIDRFILICPLAGEETGSVNIEDWELTGYINIINSFILSTKKDDSGLKKKVDKGLRQVDWENLFTPVNEK